MDIRICLERCEAELGTEGDDCWETELRADRFIQEDDVSVVLGPESLVQLASLAFAHSMLAWFAVCSVKLAGGV